MMATTPAPTPTGAPTPSVSTMQVFQTLPDSISVHTIEDHQLEALTNVSKPLPLAVAGVAAGGVLGLAPSLISALRALDTGQFGMEQAIYVALAAMLLPAAIFFGISAWQGDRKARRLIAGIRARTKRPM